MTCVLIRETQLVPSKTFKIEIFFKKIVNNLKPLTIFAATLPHTSLGRHKKN